MVASDYAAKRSALAKSIGLGQLRKDIGKRELGQTPKAVAEMRRPLHKLRRE